MRSGFGCIWWRGPAQETNQWLGWCLHDVTHQFGSSFSESPRTPHEADKIFHTNFSSVRTHCIWPPQPSEITVVGSHWCVWPFRASDIVSSWWLHLPLLRLPHQPDMCHWHSLKSQGIAKSTFSVSLQTQDGVVQQWYCTSWVEHTKPGCCSAVSQRDGHFVRLIVSAVCWRLPHSSSGPVSLPPQQLVVAPALLAPPLIWNKQQDKFAYL